MRSSRWLGRWLRRALLLAVLLPLSPNALAHAPYCMEPVGRDFTFAAPESVGLSSEKLIALSEAIDAGGHDVRSLLVLRGCKLVFERYKDGIGRDHNHSVYSVTKSVSATLVGALLHRKALASVDTPLAALIPRPPRSSEADWAKAQTISLRNVMQMGSGLAYQHNPTNNPIYSLFSDRVAVALATNVIHAPGQVFQYSDGDATLTGAAIAGISGVSLYKAGRDLLFEPLQFDRHNWLFVDQAGRYPGGWGLRLRPMDMLKLGQLYLQRGSWNGNLIFDADFVDLAWQPGPARFYALHWWLGREPNAGLPQYYAARGFKGQRIFVFPTTGIVAVVTSSLPRPEEAAVDGLVVDAMVAAPFLQATLPDGALAGRLAEVQKRGFRGVTRIYQEEQDKPY